jgi:hypothetical protein
MDSRNIEPEWQPIGILRGTNIITSSYVGKGLSGSGNRNRLEFENKPIMIIFIGSDEDGLCTVSFAHCSCGKFKAPNGGTCYITFSDNYVEWHGDDEISQLNEDGVKYYYAIITEPNMEEIL